MKTKDIVFAPVSKVPTSEILPGYLTHPYNEYAVVIDTGEHRKVVNFCSKQYELMDNETVCASFEQELKASGIPYKRKFYQHGLSQFYIEYQVEEALLKIGAKDMIIPKITIVNSYDGKIRLTTRTGFLRLVCTNGMTAPVKGSEHNMKLTHTPSIYSDGGFKTAVEHFNKFLAQAKEIIRPLIELQKAPISLNKLESTVKEVADETGFPSRQLPFVVSQIQHEVKKLDLNQANQWLLYNGFNYQLNHSQNMKMDRERRNELDSKLMNHILLEL